MTYDIAFTHAGRSALDSLERAERTYIHRKLEEITNCEFRHPTEWDFERMAGCADGRFRIGNGLRVFADIDEETSRIRVRDVRRRENLYA